MTTTTEPNIPAQQDVKSYNAEDITELDRRVHARHRIGMYLSSNSDEGISVGLRELADNSVDEALGGHGDTISITFHADGSAEVEDYGRGLPVDKNKAGINGIILTLGTIGSGGKFNSDNYASSGGMNGVGASVIIAASSMAHVISYRNGKKHELFFKEGLPGHFANATDPKSKFTSSKELKVTADDRPAAVRSKHPSGTKIRFWPDHTVFLPESKFLVDEIKFRMKSTAFLVPNLKINVYDHRDPANHVDEHYAFSSGIADMVETLTHATLVTKPLHFQTEGSFTETTNVMKAGGHMERAEVVRPVKIDVAFAFTNREETILKSYVNIINTKNGGTHEGGFYRALSRVFIPYIKEARGLLKPKEEPPTIEDIKDGLVGVLSISFPEPTYTGQEKSNLATPQITSVVSGAVTAQLNDWMKDKKNAEQVKRIALKIVEASRIRLAQKEQKDIARKKSSLESSASMPAKLVACSSSNPEEVEIQICEGESALGGLRLSRDSKTVAIYPLKGKPLNTFNLTLGKVLENQEFADLIQIFGAGIGKSFDVSQMRYKRVIILADGDADGRHIQSLLQSFFYRFMPDLIKDGRVFIAMPPLFSITTSGKNKERHYALNGEELDKLTKKLTRAGKKWDKIQRHKGLGEYSPEILAEVVMDHETRVLKRVTLEDVEKAEQTFELTMGDNPANRRKWILDNREIISEEDLDFSS